MAGCEREAVKLLLRDRLSAGNCSLPQQSHFRSRRSLETLSNCVTNSHTRKRTHVSLLARWFGSRSTGNQRQKDVVVAMRNEFVVWRQRPLCASLKLVGKSDSVLYLFLLILFAFNQPLPTKPSCYERLSKPSWLGRHARAPTQVLGPGLHLPNHADATFVGGICILLHHVTRASGRARCR